MRSGTGGLRAIGLERVWLEEAQWLTTTINDSLEAFDRGSRQDAENLVSSLMQLGLKCRNAERAAAWALDASLRDREARVVQASLANRRLQGEIDESLRTAALEDLGRSARQALGIEPSARGPASTRPTPGSEPRLTLRALGEPHAFAGIVEPGSGTPLLVFEPSSPLPESIPAEFGLFGMALLGLGAHQVGRRGRGFTWVARLALIVLCCLSAVAAGPIGLAGALLLAGLGRWQGASV
ncbi:MAG: hypothetical protein U0794_18255 [Isosphaeraceae bacterium]